LLPGTFPIWRVLEEEEQEEEERPGLRYEVGAFRKDAGPLGGTIPAREDWFESNPNELKELRKRLESPEVLARLDPRLDPRFEPRFDPKLEPPKLEPRLGPRLEPKMLLWKPPYGFERFGSTKFSPPVGMTR